MFFSKNEKDELKGHLKNIIGFKPRNMVLYEQAFRHNSSIGNSEAKEQLSNERLEFLGDAILGAIVADMVFMRYPLKDEGFLTDLRSKIVSRESLADIALKMGLKQLIVTEPGLRNNLAVTRSIAGNCLEALIGAIFVDRGYDKVRKFVHERILQNYVDLAELSKKEFNFKSKLIEFAQRSKQKIRFEVVNERMEGGRRVYTISAYLGEQQLGTGADFSKKKAEQLAADQACETLGLKQ
jgi:ribonuclease-3